MVKTLRECCSWLVSNPGQAAAWTYVIIGFIVVFYVASRARWWRTPPNQTWDKRDNAVNVLDLFFSAGSLHPIALLIQILLWPLWILGLWAYQSDDDETI